jgi:hypothetical protein
VRPLVDVDSCGWRRRTVARSHLVSQADNGLANVSTELLEWVDRGNCCRYTGWTYPRESHHVDRHVEPLTWTEVRASPRERIVERPVPVGHVCRLEQHNAAVLHQPGHFIGGRNDPIAAFELGEPDRVLLRLLQKALHALDDVQ